jgi:hypothetical protein
MCATVSWGAHESFMHPIFVRKNGCDSPVHHHRPHVLAHSTSAADLQQSMRAPMVKKMTGRSTVPHRTHHASASGAQQRAPRASISRSDASGAPWPDAGQHPVLPDLTAHRARQFDRTLNQSSVRSVRSSAETDRMRRCSLASVRSHSSFARASTWTERTRRCHRGQRPVTFSDLFHLCFFAESCRASFPLKTLANVSTTLCITLCTCVSIFS